MNAGKQQRTHAIAYQAADPPHTARPPVAGGQYSHTAGTKRKTSPTAATRPTDGNGK